MPEGLSRWGLAGLECVRMSLLLHLYLSAKRTQLNMLSRRLFFCIGNIYRLLNVFETFFLAVVLLIV